ncbi:helix-turn-helix domain-containing protein [Piscinibacter sp. XHJ-5]|uniref:helix-turn-helix transcriptional regulator n=1 Tax=Piscinibacter sp. XHJ-5 TaxID=3037797 RepID=UPI002453133B|nr:helix-turn-helix domain-containing protein [Piscinibacter sp. XHJ-5]
MDTPTARAVDGAFRTIVMPVAGALTPYVGGLMAVEMQHVPPLEQRVAPHESMVLSVQFGRGADGVERKAALGENTHLTGIRRWTGSFIPAGDCVTLFALLTPLGAAALLEGQPLSGVPRIRARVAELLDRRVTRDLESHIALAASLEDKLQALAGWLELRAATPRRTPAAAIRTARAAMRMLAEPASAVDGLADDELLSRRQLERDFARWLDTSPRHLSQVARLQRVSRLARRGESLASAAAGAGFADQSHMSRVVRQLTGLTPQRFVHSHTTPLSTAFRAATRGATVYL